MESSAASVSYGGYFLARFEQLAARQDHEGLL